MNNYLNTSGNKYNYHIFMNQETALNQVYESLLGDNSIPLQLRMRQGLDQARFQQLTEAIRFLTNYYAQEETIPKKLALALVDIYGSFSFQENFYNDSDSIIIEDAGMLLQVLATELFS